MKHSKGEEKIISLLKKQHISFVTERQFQDLRRGHFRFDFYLPDLNTIVEFDGEQHFKQVTYFQHNRSEFLKQQENDRQKNSYCLANKIDLYRIPFWDIDNISTAADLFADKYKVKNRFHNDNIWREYQKNLTKN